MTNVGKIAMVYLLLGSLCMGAVVYFEFRGEPMPHTQIYGTVFVFIAAGFFVVDHEIRKFKR